MDSIAAISLFSGAGGLDLGLSIAAPGIRWLAHVEREAYAAAILAARMEDKTLDAAPVWSDVTTFDGKPWHGKVDLIAGGFPCTDLSVAGKQAGINGAASGLWWEFARIICEIQPRWIFIENVPAVISAEPARAVLGELSRLGFDAEWTTLRASEVGASHQRKRAFILAYSHGRRFGKCREQDERSAFTDTVGSEESSLGDTESNDRRGELQPGKQTEHGRTRPTGAGAFMADPGQPGPQRREQEELCRQRRRYERRTATESYRAPFPPGPRDTEEWKRILRTNPEISPALSEKEAESLFRGNVNGLANVLDERRHRLRSTGNGVVCAQASAAFVLLAKRAGIEKEIGVREVETQASGTQ